MEGGNLLFCGFLNHVLLSVTETDYGRMRRSSSRSFLLRRRYAMTGAPADRLANISLRSRNEQVG